MSKEILEQGKPEKKTCCKKSTPEFAALFTRDKYPSSIPYGPQLGPCWAKLGPSWAPLPHRAHQPFENKTDAAIEENRFFPAKLRMNHHCIYIRHFSFCGRTMLSKHNMVARHFLGGGLENMVGASSSQFYFPWSVDFL